LVVARDCSLVVARGDCLAVARGDCLAVARGDCLAVARDSFVLLLELDERSVSVAPFTPRDALLLLVVRLACVTGWASRPRQLLTVVCGTP
jgi:hypothetical protein